MSEALPSLSVVVVILAGREYLVRCLASLTAQRGVPTPEIIVPHDDSLDDVSSLQEQFSAVTFLHEPGRHSYAELRAIGFRSARGEIVALTEDHCLPVSDWCAVVLREHDAAHAAVGGPVDKAEPDTVLNWAIYLCDFSRYANPVREGPAGYLTDCNVSYKRRALVATSRLWQQEFHETTVNWALLDQGETLWLSRDMLVRQQRSLAMRDALKERYAFGRLFASTRVAATTAARRLFYAMVSPLLLVILLGRVVVNVARKRRYGWAFARSLPWVVVLSLVWAVGEFVGYLTARAAPVESGGVR